MENEQHFGRIAAVYLLGLLLGGLYVGIIAPLRTVVQADLGIGNETGIWIVNIYTLFYAACIPAVGKLADRHGRARVFTLCLLVFSVGCILCGMAQFAGGFGLLIVGRIVQAAGAGGIIPVATAEMGASAPEDKRGMWLGMAAATAGLSNVLGAATGSAVIGIVGAANWCWVFFGSLPISAVLIACALLWLPNHVEEKSAARFDALGSIMLVIFVLLLLIGLRGVNFFDVAGSLAQSDVWVPLLAAVIAAVGFVLVERRADDPIFRSDYMRNRDILLTMAASLFVGGVIISMVLIPEFAEYALGMPVGSGGYYMAVMGVFAIVGPPVGGKIIDTRGPVPVLVFGLVTAGIGFLLLALVATAYPSVLTIMVGLVVIGLGLGFAMGTPLNYMILQVVDPGESTTAIAALSLVRQVGTTIAPAFLVGFTVSFPGMEGYRYLLLGVVAFCAIACVFAFGWRGKA